MAERNECEYVASEQELLKLDQNTEVEAYVHINKLRPDWEFRSFQITFPASILHNKLYHFIFDWSFLEQLRLSKPSDGAQLIQQKAHDLHTLYTLNQSLPRAILTFKPDVRFHVSWNITRPTYDVKVANGIVKVQQLPNLIINVSLPLTKRNQSQTMVAISSSIFEASKVCETKSSGTTVSLLSKMQLNDYGKRKSICSSISLAGLEFQAQETAPTKSLESKVVTIFTGNDNVSKEEKESKLAFLVSQSVTVLDNREELAVAVPEKIGSAVSVGELPVESNNNYDENIATSSRPTKSEDDVARICCSMPLTVQDGDEQDVIVPLKTLETKLPIYIVNPVIIDTITECVTNTMDVGKKIEEELDSLTSLNEVMEMQQVHPAIPFSLPDLESIYHANVAAIAAVAAQAETINLEVIMRETVMDPSKRRRFNLMQRISKLTRQARNIFRPFLQR